MLHVVVECLREDSVFFGRLLRFHGYDQIGGCSERVHARIGKLRQHRLGPGKILLRLVITHQVRRNLIAYGSNCLREQLLDLLHFVLVQHVVEYLLLDPALHVTCAPRSGTPFPLWRIFNGLRCGECILFQSLCLLLIATFVRNRDAPQHKCPHIGLQPCRFGLRCLEQA